MILHLFHMRRNVNQNFFNDRKNVSATALRVTSPTTISRRFHTVAAIAAIQQRRCRAGLLDNEYRQDEAAELDAAGLPREDPPRASIIICHATRSAATSLYQTRQCSASSRPKYTARRTTIPCWTSRIPALYLVYLECCASL